MAARGSSARSRARSSGATARLLVLCAVLAGLFLMHGTPGSARGCHGPTAPGISHVTGAGAGHPATGALRTHGDTTLCVVTKSRDGVTLPAPGPPFAGVLPVLLTAVTRSFGRRADSPRGPPSAGRRLLLQVCVART